MTRPRRSAAPEAPPKKSRKNEKEADRKDGGSPPPKKRRNNQTEEVDEDEPASEVAKLKSSPEKSDSPLLVFAHGAGANSSHEWMVRCVWRSMCHSDYVLLSYIISPHPGALDGLSLADELPLLK